MTTTTPPTRLATRPAARAITAAEPARTDWRGQAACRAADPELFFPVGNGPAADFNTTAAKRICGRCPSRTECLEWALDTKQQSGVWGGLSEQERRDLVQAGEQSFVVCLDNQQYIEEQLAAKVAQRTIAEELGVSYNILRRAIGYLAKEQQDLGVAA